MADYKEPRSVAGGSPVTEDYRSIDDYDNDENIGLGSLAVQHKFNDKGHELSGSAYYKYGGHALEYFFNDLMSLEGQRQQVLMRPSTGKRCVSIWITPCLSEKEVS